MKKVLPIGDHESMRRIALRILEREGFKPLRADNGRKGLGLAQTQAVSTAR